MYHVCLYLRYVHYTLKQSTNPPWAWFINYAEVREDMPAFNPKCLNYGQAHPQRVCT